MGALDLDIRPKNAEVYVDGQYVGLARQYDGFPGYLWLEKGVYEISLYRPGFETESRPVKVLTGLVLDLEIDLQDGEAIKPELRIEPPAVRERDEQAGREIVDRLKRSRRTVEHARMHLSVEPPTAEIFLDGNYLGTGEELSGLHAGLVLSAGEHTLEVRGDGYEPEVRDLNAAAGDDLEITLELEPRAGSRSR